jgi:hypothetical protein
MVLFFYGIVMKYGNSSLLNGNPELLAAFTQNRETGNAKSVLFGLLARGETAITAAIRTPTHTARHGSIP